MLTLHVDAEVKTLCTGCLRRGYCFGDDRTALKELAALPLRKAPFIKALGCQMDLYQLSPF
jgi:hypothetical protein